MRKNIKNVLCVEDAESYSKIRWDDRTTLGATVLSFYEKVKVFEGTLLIKDVFN
jgi:hypothetical protein